MNIAIMHKLQTCNLNPDAYAVSLKESVATSLFVTDAWYCNNTGQEKVCVCGGGGGLEDCWLISASQFKKASRHCMNCCHPIKGANLPSSSEEKKVLISVCHEFSVVFFFSFFFSPSAS